MLHRHGLDRGVRRPGRPGRLLGLEGRHRRHDAAGRPRPRAATASASTRSPRACSTRRCWPRCPRRRARRSASTVPFPPRLGQPVGVRAARAVDHREPDAQRRDDPPRRRDPHGAALTRRGGEGAARRHRAAPGRPPRDLSSAPCPYELSPTPRRSRSASISATCSPARALGRGHRLEPLVRGPDSSGASRRPGRTTAPGERSPSSWTGGALAALATSHRPRGDVPRAPRTRSWRRRCRSSTPAARRSSSTATATTSAVTSPTSRRPPSATSRKAGLLVHIGGHIAFEIEQIAAYCRATASSCSRTAPTPTARRGTAAARD